MQRTESLRVLALLEHLDAGLLRGAQCWFGGGAAVALRCAEFRVSRNVDFLCASRDGYRAVRERVHHEGAQGLFQRPVTVVREARADRYGIRTAVEIEGQPVKVEIVSEGRIDLVGFDDPSLPVARLCDVDLVAEKVLANDDRHGDDSGLARDTIDLVVLEHVLGTLPEAALHKAVAAYGPSVAGTFVRSLEKLRARPLVLARWLDLLDVSEEARTWIAAKLDALPPPSSG